MPLSPVLSSRGKTSLVLLLLSGLIHCFTAVTAAEKAAAAPERDTQKLLQMAEAAFKQGQRAEAVILADQAIAADPMDRSEEHTSELQSR